MNTNACLLGLSLVLCAMWAATSVADQREWSRATFLGTAVEDPEVTALVRAAKADRNLIKEFGQAPTKATRAALLRIAYGENGDVDEVFAASVFARRVEDRGDARALLAATRDEVIAMGLATLPGQPVDASLLDRLTVILQMDSARLRYLAANVLAGDPLKGNARRKAQLVLESMKTTLQCRDAEVRVGSHTEYFHHRWTWAELSLVHQGVALARICDTIPEFLLEMDLPELGCAHDFLVLARAWGAEGSGRDAVRQVLLESESEMARMEALKFLEVNSAKEDLEAFQLVASRDPFEAEPAPRYFDIPGADRELEDKPRARIFPLRFLAEHALGMHAGQTITGPRSPILGIP
jgi:hypothetical protein